MMDELLWKDVYVVFIGNVKDVILKKVAAIRLAPDSDEWVFKSPNGSEFVFNNRYIVHVQIVPHGCEIPISATRDEITYDFSNETYTSEPCCGGETVIPESGPYYFKIGILDRDLPEGTNFNYLYLAVNGVRVGIYNVTEDCFKVSSGAVERTLVFELYDEYENGYKLKSMFSDEERFNFRFEYLEQESITVLNLITKGEE